MMIRGSRFAGVTLAGIAALSASAGTPAHGDKASSVDIDQIHKQFAAKDALIADLRKQIADLQAQLDKLKGQSATAPPPASPAPVVAAIPPAVAMNVLPQYRAIVLEPLQGHASAAAMGLNAYGKIAGYSQDATLQDTPVTWDLRSTTPYGVGMPGGVYNRPGFPPNPGQMPGGQAPFPGQMPGGPAPDGQEPGGMGAAPQAGADDAAGTIQAGAIPPGARPGPYPGAGGFPGAPGGFQPGGPMMPARPQFDARYPKSLGSSAGVANAINARGAVAGIADGKAALWRAGKAEDLGLPDGTVSSEALGLNNKPDVVGDTINGAGNHLPFLKPDGAAIQMLGLLNGWDNGIARHVNDLGIVVGKQTKSAGGAHACFWINGAPTDLGTLGGDKSEAVDVNNSGVIVGSSDTSDKHVHACYWRSGKIHDLELPSGSSDAEAHAINDAGVIVGQADGQAAIAWIKEKAYKINDAVKDKGFVIKNAIAVDGSGGILASGTVPGEDGDHAILLIPTK